MPVWQSTRQPFLLSSHNAPPHQWRGCAVSGEECCVTTHNGCVADQCGHLLCLICNVTLVNKQDLLSRTTCSQNQAQTLIYPFIVCLVYVLCFADCGKQQVINPRCLVYPKEYHYLIIYLFLFSRGSRRMGGYQQIRSS